MFSEYLNGHLEFKSELKMRAKGYPMIDNTDDQSADFKKAQSLVFDYTISRHR